MKSFLVTISAAILLIACTTTQPGDVQPQPRAADYIFTDPAVEHDALQHEARLLDAQRKLMAVESVHSGLSPAAGRGVANAPGAEVPGPLQDSRRYRTPSDETERRLLEDAVRGATIDFNRFLAHAVRNGTAIKRSGLTPARSD